MPFEAAQRLQLDLGVAAAGEQPAGIAVTAVFGGEEVLAQLPAAQPQDGADLLDVFTGTVDRARQLVVGDPVETLDDLRGAPGGDSPQALADLLLPLQAVCPRARARARRGRRAGFGQVAVRVARVAGDLAAEPGGWVEGGALAGAGELDLGDEQSDRSPS